jgi:hypothetical protein
MHQQPSMKDECHRHQVTAHVIPKSKDAENSAIGRCRCSATTFRNFISGNIRSGLAPNTVVNCHSTPSISPRAADEHAHILHCIYRFSVATRIRRDSSRGVPGSGTSRALVLPTQVHRSWNKLVAVPFALRKFLASPKISRPRVRSRGTSSTSSVEAV